MATIFKLIIEDDEGKTTVYPLSEGEINIGRREGNTIRLMERNVSRRHAKLARNNGTVFIEDLDSYNGIRINGERITGKYEVKEGDLVEIGDYHLALQRTEVKEQQQAPQGQQGDGQWPQAGTVPDFRLPEEILQDVQHYDRGPRDTLHDEVVPGAMATPAIGTQPPQADPMVRPPPRGNDEGLRDLPPFPTPGGAPLAKVPLNRGTPAGTEEPTEPPSEKALAIGPARVSNVPRLVCVSTTYAGKEFALTRPELIIGRVEDNDIVIEHRSVSRNHAKILSNNNTHKIIDLQSANGILVNGEEYAMTDLRKGDLIELGHVRFRFIPASEAFIPNEEEAAEMRSAGVEPPTREAAKLDAPPIEDPPPAPAASVGAYDPSQAATVTDTPLDALTVGQSFAPNVESRTVPMSQRPTSAPKAAPIEPPPKRATEDERPTELNRVGRPGGQSPLASPAAVAAPRHDSVEPSTRQERLDDSPRAPKSKVPLIVALVLLLTAAVVLSLLVMMPSSSPDEQLAALFSDLQYAEVVKYYEANEGKFEDAKKAEMRYRDALDRVGEKTPDEPPPPVPEPDPIPPKGDADIRDEPPPPPPPPRTKTTKKRVVKRDPPPKKRRTRRASDKNVEEIFRAGNQYLMRGELKRAEKSLLECIAIDPKHAKCHRSLGVLYAQFDNYKKSVSHYKQYLRLAPDGPEADRVRKLIDDPSIQ